VAGFDEVPIKPRDFLRRHPNLKAGYSVAQPNPEELKRMAGQTNPQQPQQPQQQPAQAPAQPAGQHDPQALAAAAQLGQAVQQAGLNPGTLFQAVALLQRHAPALLALLEDLRTLAGAGGGATPGAAPTPPARP
jgi:hypothetical protein